MGGVAHALVGTLVGDDRTHENVGVAAKVFGHGLYHDVHAVLERFEIQWCRPSVVNDGGDVVLARDGGDGGNILDFQSERTRAFEENHTCIRLDECLNTRPNQWVIVGCAHTITFEQIVTQLACRTVSGIHHQHMIACAQLR